MSTNASRPLAETVIEPRTGWRLVDLSELRDYGDLLWFLVYRNLKGRYVQSSLGLGWVVIQPVVTLMIFTLVFGRVVKIQPPGGTPFSVFVFIGLVSWQFFSGAMTSAGASIHGESSVVSKVYFPRLILPLSVVLSRLVDLMVSLVLLLVLMALNGLVPPPRALLIVPMLVILVTCLALGMGLWLSALAVQYRDVAYSMGFMAQIWMYLSPIFYSPEMIPERFRLIFGLNPMVGIITGLRSGLVDYPPFPWALVAQSVAITAVVLVSGALYFRRSERLFADVV
ncbi:ABC transporter permease [Tautonia plasticadhaerens]|uniref:Transport permease protein n=1 Tax=Tautonia plasticadhaerens TaxID=2527974 RepID=A0A518H5Q0_9BACT|nr:ABC transporter permease [Tautonia plasticadhaerens]QDV36166.1 Teichoic acid translocation permease protein TagG [Tautonia plasticadhaerens]